MAVFFTSDTHFGDQRVLNLYPRPFVSVAEMDAALIARWNDLVGSDDEVWHLGDFARSTKSAAENFRQLKGRKHLVVGNIDSAFVRELAWASIAPYAEIEVEGVKLILCHYPFRSWNGMHRGAVNLHGHSHGRLNPLPRQLDVGVDARDYRPVRLSELLLRR
ncbi:metallophosphoesterase family protein [Hansschlegelia quercus]|uniref:Metallophosphoesterase n=1 Tax=Hansschlegelia quercus TaxID=2528245 RepID=A0A4Q9GJK5_9HYPH|nr:metallophosphoesterase family protein [Hansschlegelia quercus]TBN54443.1 metallophosphoesterase [Hansschlegelia quercus]